MEETLPSQPTDEAQDKPARQNLLKTFFARVGAALRSLAFGKDGWRGATLASLLVFVLAAALQVLVVASGPAPDWVAVPVMLIAMLLLGALANLIGTVILPLVGRLLVWLPKNFMWGVLCAVIGVYLVFMGLDSANLVLAGVVTVSVTLLGAAIAVLRKPGWAGLARGQRVGAGGALLLGIAGAAALGYFLAFEGIPSPAPLNAGELSAVPALDLPDPSQPGEYEVQTFTYGSGEDLHRPEYGAQVTYTTDAVDGSALIDGWNGLTGDARSRYWGFNASRLPVNGRVWAPKGEGPFPLVLVVHGNHSAQDFSDPGYAYLGELLASRGFILVSVDENFLNGTALDFVLSFGSGGLKGENDARGWLLLEHLSQWREWMKDENHPLYGLADLDRIAVMGHSRGGEAAAIAAAFNRLPAYPDNGAVRFDYNFNIRSVIAIAPVDGQYYPSNVGTRLKDVSYFTIQGVHDSDMRSFDGQTQYQRVSFTPGSPYFKSTLLIYGANHGQFNTVWGRTDHSGPVAALLNLSNLMPGEEQRQIAKVYFTAFLEDTLHERSEYRPLFENYRAGQTWLPDTVYVNAYADAHTRTLAGFEEDVDLSTGAQPEVKLDGRGLQKWSEAMVGVKWGVMDNKAIFLNWDQSKDALARYWLELPADFGVTAENELVFSLAETSWEKDLEEAPDFSIVLSDDNGESAVLPLSSVMPLQPQLEGQVVKLPFTSSTSTREIVFQTYIFPLEKFVEANPDFDPQKLVKIAFIFNKTAKGSLALDEIGLR